MAESRWNLGISLEIPLECPPYLAAQAATWALRAGRDMLRGVGFSQKQRVHKSSPVSSVKATHKTRGKPGFVDALNSHCRQEGRLDIELIGGNVSRSDALVCTSLRGRVAAGVSASCGE